VDYFTRRELRLLIEEQAAPCVSIYLPTERTGPESEKDRILLRNLLGKVRDRLEAAGGRRDEIDALTQPVVRLLEATFFWPCGCNGLAIFRSPDMFRPFRLPLRFEPLAVVSGRFHIKPLLPLLMASGAYYILALSRGAVRLLHASKQRVTEVGLPEAPESIDETLRFDDPEKQLQFHTGTRGRGGRRSAVYHGQGVGTDDSEANTLRFLQEVDRGVHAVLREESAPLVLAAVEELQGLYRRASSYVHLLDRGIVHNPEDLSTEELKKRAWEIVEPLFARSLREASEEYLALAGRESAEAASGIRTILPAAASGQVGTLFVAKGEHMWGRFEPPRGLALEANGAGEGVVDLLDLVAAETLLHGGRVYAVDPSDVPGGGPVSAILRYPALAEA
jgi:hypothetical protein